MKKFSNIYFFNGTAYAGKSTMVKRLAEKYDGIACEENYHESLMKEISQEEFPNLSYTANLTDWAEFIRRFFDRPDREKQFLYQLLLAEKDSEKAIANFRECLARVNSQGNYNKFLNSGFNVLIRDESRSIEDTMKIVVKYLKL